MSNPFARMGRGSAGRTQNPAESDAQCAAQNQGGLHTQRKDAKQGTEYDKMKLAWLNEACNKPHGFEGSAVVTQKRLDTLANKGPDSREAKKISKRIRNAVTDYERGSLWKIWARADECRRRLPQNVYQHLAAFKVNEFDAEIRKDINRTFPGQVGFKDAGHYQRALHNVLRAYALYNPEVGYCQGMAFIAGMLVIYMNEEDAFFTMICIMDKHDIKRLFVSDMPQLNRYCFVVEQYVRRKMPRLQKHLQKHEVHLTLLCTQWFLTLFTYNFDLDAAALLWDHIISREENVILPIAIAILRLIEPLLLALNEEQIHHIMKDLTPHLPARAIIQQMRKQKLTHSVKKLLKQYDSK